MPGSGVFEDVSSQELTPIPVGEPVGLKSVSELLDDLSAVEKSQSSSLSSLVYIPKIGDSVDWWAEDESLALLANLYGEGPFTVEKLIFDEKIGYLAYLSKETKAGLMVFSRKQFLETNMASGWRLVVSGFDLHETANIPPLPEDCFLAQFIRKA